LGSSHESGNDILAIEKIHLPIAGIEDCIVSRMDTFRTQKEASTLTKDLTTHTLEQLSHHKEHQDESPSPPSVTKKKACKKCKEAKGL
jgi:hypothetical protein